MGIRRKRLGERFRREVLIGHWVADFACLDPKIVIEVDDPSIRIGMSGEGPTICGRKASRFSDTTTSRSRGTTTA